MYPFLLLFVYSRGATTTKQSFPYTPKKFPGNFADSSIAVIILYVTVV